MLKRRTKLILCALAIVAAGAVTTVLVMHFKKPDLRGRYKELVDSATEVRLYKDLALGPEEDKGPNRAKEIIISDKKVIQSLFGGLELQDKRPCECGHSEWAVIISPKGKCVLSLCHHCFNVISGRGRYANYHMPPGFFQAYQEAWHNPTSMPISKDDFFRKTEPPK